MAEDELIEIKVQVGVLMRGWFNILRFSSAMYTYHWSDDKEIAKLGQLRRDMVYELKACHTVNSRRVRSRLSLPPPKTIGA